MCHLRLPTPCCSSPHLNGRCIHHLFSSHSPPSLPRTLHVRRHHRLCTMTWCTARAVLFGSRAVGTAHLSRAFDASPARRERAFDFVGTQCRTTNCLVQHGPLPPDTHEGPNGQVLRADGMPYLSPGGLPRYTWAAYIAAEQALDAQDAATAPVQSEPSADNAGAATEGASSLQGVTREPPTRDSPAVAESLDAMLATGPVPSDLGLSPAELDAAFMRLQSVYADFDAAVASPAAMDMAVAPCQPVAAEPDVTVAPCQPAAHSGEDDSITEIHPATPRGRGESIKRRKRSRKPGDHRHGSQ